VNQDSQLERQRSTRDLENANHPAIGGQHWARDPFMSPRLFRDALRACRYNSFARRGKSDHWRSSKRRTSRNVLAYVINNAAAGPPVQTPPRPLRAQQAGDEAPAATACAAGSDEAPAATACAAGSDEAPAATAGSAGSDEAPAATACAAGSYEKSRSRTVFRPSLRALSIA
jgi:hypothetical protein